MRLVAALALPTVLSVVAPARAEDGALRLTWSAPPGCPQVEEVRSATLRETGPPQSAGEDVLEAEANVEQTDADGGWRVRLRTRRGTITGEREIEAATCNGVAEATAVVLALALVPPATADEAPATAAPPRSAPRERDAPAHRATGEDHHAFALGASVTGDTSSLPAAAAGGSLTLAWTPGRARIELDVRLWAPQSQTLARSEAGARFSMTSLGGRGCWAALRGVGLELSACAGADVHVISAPGYGADANYPADGAWTTVTGGGLGRFELTSRIALRARAEAFAPLSRPTFVVQNEGLLHRPASIGAAASFGVEVLFL